MTLIVGFAPGKDDRAGIELAAVLARTDGDDVRVVTVTPAPWPTPVARGSDNEYAEWSRAHGEAAVEEASALIEEICPDVVAEAEWVDGRSAASALLERARETGARLVVVGSGHGGAYGQVYVSSTADVLLHSATVPVAIAPRGYEPGERVRVGRATCAFRGDEASRRTLARTAEICARAGAVLRVATFAVRGRAMHPSPLGPRDEETIMDAWIEQAGTAQAEALAGLAQPHPVRIESVVADGRTWQAAMDRLAWDRGEVLVIGSSRTGPVSRLFLGSHATKILRASPVPVIVVP